MTAERRARVWLWLSYQASLESDDLLYAYPRPEGRDGDVDALLEQSDACAARAEEIFPGATSELWQWSTRTFGEPAS